MKRKWYISLAICILLASTLTACSDTNPNLKDNNVQLGGTGETSQNSENYRPVDRPKFESMTEIKEFLDQVGTINQNESEGEPVDVSATASTLLYPVLVCPSDAEAFGATWYSEKNSLDLAYKIDGIRYRFIYFFGSDYVWETDEEPSVSDMKLGAYTVDFWAQEHANFDVRFYGYVKMDDVYITITVTGNEIDSPNFEAFDFAPLSSVSGDVTE